jgi:hypothetical protein
MNPLCIHLARQWVRAKPVYECRPGGEIFNEARAGRPQPDLVALLIAALALAALLRRPKAVIPACALAGLGVRWLGLA